MTTAKRISWRMVTTGRMEGEWVHGTRRLLLSENVARVSHLRCFQALVSHLSGYRTYGAW